MKTENVKSTNRVIQIKGMQNYRPVAEIRKSAADCKSII
jgi:hypothetical protein